MSDEHFIGHRNPDRHRTVGPHRAWCECGTWCYPRVETACRCCVEALADENPCPTCGGTGYAPERVRVYNEHGEPEDLVLRTKSGRVLTEADVLALAEEAERGYNV